MSKLAVGIITALVVFLLTAMFGTTYNGGSASDWFNKYQATENIRQADFNAITCVRGIAYINFPNLGWYYNLGAVQGDSTNTYYSKYAVDSCLYGL